MPPGQSQQVGPAGRSHQVITPGQPYPPASAPGFPTGSSSLSYPPPPEGGSWVARLVIAGALIVILVASAILYHTYQQLNPGTEALTTTGRARVPITPPIRKTGSVTLESIPNGATIFLDGKPMALPNGENAKTPSDLHSLQYGSSYHIKLRMEGYEVFQTTVEMGEKEDGKTIRPTLNAFKGTLVVEVDGDRRRDIQVLVDDKEQGLGPRVELDLPGHKSVRVSGRLSGYRCEEEVVRIEPSRTTNTKIGCKVRSKRPPKRTSAVASTKPPPPKSTAKSTPKSSRRIGSGDCKTNPSLPPGFATIQTKPYSDVYWNGRHLGQTPLARYKLPSGCVTVTAKALGGKGSKTVRLKIEPNRVMIYNFKIP